MDHSTDSAEVIEMCTLCSKKFNSVKLLNRHLKRVHKIAVLQSNHVICPLCEERTPDKTSVRERTDMRTHEDLIKHLKVKHERSIEMLSFQFANTQEYKTWKNTEKIEVAYAMHRSNRNKDHKKIYYDCNRSDHRGYQVNYQKRTEKSGGTIKIQGICPSRLICRIYDNGNVTVDFWKTHAGHDEKELRSKHLSTTEKNSVIEKLQAGVPINRILEDARKLEMPELERINLLNTNDVTYLSRKYNIEKRRDQNEMVAVTLKVQEWNADEKNFAFFFKPEGEMHHILKKEDFALGFMNSTMEDKLRKFTNVICMDGTHGTNRRGMDLTIMLIKDDKNAGFPVAFFLSNRQDQEVQEVLLGALKDKMQKEIQADHFMSDDDSKYFNAWVKIMGNKPKRLLCSWHVIKNWNIQGKKKIKDPIMKKQMKSEMKKIINETSEDRFLTLTNTYLEKLQEANEFEFIHYLTRYYFQDEERIKMWAHCYRKNSGINTNMSIESLNNLLKTNKLKRNSRVTIEKLLDTIEDLVDIKMWRRILDIERPNSNNYQDRIIIKAHKKAEAIMDKVEVIENAEKFGSFQVKSSRYENVYNISLRQVCESKCRTLYCRVCKICIHRYQCDCPEYTVKNTLCKHVHLIRMHEKRSGTNFVLDDAAETLGENSVIESQQQEEITKFVREQVFETTQVQQNVRKRSIQWVHFKNWAEDLDDKNFEFFMEKIQGAMKEVDQRQNKITTKRKMEKQTYFPTNKKNKLINN